jgi:hypothetical protein
MTQQLSPATQAVLTAFRERYTEALRPGPFPDYWQEACLAAALTTLAVRIKGADGICQDVLDIVSELETLGLYDDD